MTNEEKAEEYAESTKTEKEIEVLNTVHVWGSESLSPEERHLLGGIQDRKEAKKQGFQAGAEFGYNKCYEQLIKAKELLEKLLEEEKNNMYWEMNGSDNSSYYEVRKQAEQFLNSEVEK